MKVITTPPYLDKTPAFRLIEQANFAYIWSINNFDAAAVKVITTVRTGNVGIDSELRMTGEKS